jgi:hypothetical protein
MKPQLVIVTVLKIAQHKENLFCYQIQISFNCNTIVWNFFRYFE